ncbi:hypothetical protein [Sphingobacterium sp. MYb382]|uniref:hypothetical protein n=1 Tax=Sphingobacterium sp. MYb382 TaxID=2745278 RepID=UPI00309CBAA5
MQNLLTRNPAALQALMSEALFSTGEDLSVAPAVEAAIAVADTAVATPQVTSEQEEFIYQGDKSTGVLFILRYPAYPYFSPAAEEAFVKTIGALQLNLQNVAVVNLANAHNPNDFKRIMAFFQPKKITLLGVEPASLKLPAIAHNAYMKGKIATVFNTFSFEEMFADIAKKKAFWGEFKSFLSV